MRKRKNELRTSTHVLGYTSNIITVDKIDEDVARGKVASVIIYNGADAIEKIEAVRGVQRTADGASHHIIVLKLAVLKKKKPKMIKPIIDDKL